METSREIHAANRRAEGVRPVAVGWLCACGGTTAHRGPDVGRARPPPDDVDSRGGHPNSAWKEHVDGRWGIVTKKVNGVAAINDNEGVNIGRFISDSAAS